MPKVRSVLDNRLLDGRRIGLFIMTTAYVVGAYLSALSGMWLTLLFLTLICVVPWLGTLGQHLTQANRLGYAKAVAALAIVVLLGMLVLTVVFLRHILVDG